VKWSSVTSNKANQCWLQLLNSGALVIFGDTSSLLWRSSGGALGLSASEMAYYKNGYPMQAITSAFTGTVFPACVATACPAVTSSVGQVSGECGAGSAPGSMCTLTCPAGYSANSYSNTVQAIAQASTTCNTWSLEKSVGAAWTRTVDASPSLPAVPNSLLQLIHYRWRLKSLQDDHSHSHVPQGMDSDRMWLHKSHAIHLYLRAPIHFLLVAASSFAPR